MVSSIVQKTALWRFWAGLAFILAADTGFGFWLANDGIAELWVERIGLLTAIAAPLGFAITYTVFGIRAQHGAARWWEVPLGSAIVMAALSLLPICAPLAWVFWVDGGLLHQSWLAWAEVSGPGLSAMAWLRVTWLWVLERRQSRQAA